MSLFSVRIGSAHMSNWLIAQREVGTGKSPNELRSNAVGDAAGHGQSLQAMNPVNLDVFQLPTLCAHFFADPEQYILMFYLLLQALLIRLDSLQGSFYEKYFVCSPSLKSHWLFVLLPQYVFSFSLSGSISTSLIGFLFFLVCLFLFYPFCHHCLPSIFPFRFHFGH